MIKRFTKDCWENERNYEKTREAREKRKSGNGKEKKHRKKEWRINERSRGKREK